MSFKHVIFKNFTQNVCKYLSYYLAGTFCVAMFFIYSTLMELDDVMNHVDEYPMFALFAVCCLIISLFSVIFINYAHQTYMRNKKRELAVYMVVGMDEKATRLMVVIETGIIALASILSGILCGCLFSRFFQMIVQKLVNVDSITYQLSVRSFWLTALVFAAIYTFCFIRTDLQLKREDLSSIMKEQKKKQSRPFRKRDMIYAVIGIISMIFSAVFIINVASDDHINSKLWVLLTFLITGYVGLFLVVGYGIKAYVAISQRRKNYYSRMLTVSGINYKYHQNLRVVLILSMLASMIVLLVGAPIALVSLSVDIAEDGNKDVIYVTYADYKEDVVESIIRRKEVDSWDKQKIHYMQDLETQELKPVISASEYNEQMESQIDRKIEVLDSTVYHMITSWEPGNHGVNPGDSYSIGTSAGSSTYTVCDSVKGKWDYSNVFLTKSILILSDHDYAAIQSQLPVVEMNAIMYQKGWKDTKPILTDLKSELQKQLGDACYVNSRIDVYQNLRSGYSVFLFVSSFMCLMFFISTGCVLYFKQYNDIEEEKQQYQQLYKIGISDREVRRSISIKMAIVYFVPLAGTIMGLLIMYYMASIFGGHEIIVTFMNKGMIGLICYAISQLAFYLLLRFKYLHDVLRTNTQM